VSYEIADSPEIGTLIAGNVHKLNVGLGAPGNLPIFLFFFY